MMLRPQDTPTRERKSLSGLWEFRLDASGAGRGERWFGDALTGAVQAPVPASYNDLFADAAVRDHVGDAWYQTVVRVPRGWTGQRIVLRFDSATHRAVVWVGETVVAEHEGGYTPFEADVTDLVIPGDDTGVVAAGTGVHDRAPVVTEPFGEWVLAGDFAAGRPRWQDAGATFTADIAPFEERKLWLLNGAHSLLAYAGSIRGHSTVAEAMGDPTCRAWVQEWWEAASEHLTQPAEELTAYRAALAERFANPRMRHRLDQIAADGAQKLAIRKSAATARMRAAVSALTRPGRENARETVDGATPAAAATS